MVSMVTIAYGLLTSSAQLGQIRVHAATHVSFAPREGERDWKKLAPPQGAEIIDLP
jgi:hypothetical protein